MAARPWISKQTAPVVLLPELPIARLHRLGHLPLDDDAIAKSTGSDYLPLDDDAIAKSTGSDF
jgi:hypothetical protein